MKRENIVAPEIHFPELDKFFDWLEEQNYSYRTIENYKVGIYKFCKDAQINDVPGFVALTPIYFREYVEKLQQEFHYSAASINIELAALRKWYWWLERYDFVKECPVKEHVRNKPVRESTWLTTDQIKKVLDACTSKRDKALFTMLFESGMRYSEIINIHIGDVENRQDPETKTNYGCVWVNGKGNKRRLIGISRRELFLINDYLVHEHPSPDKDNWLFVTRTNGFMYDADVNSALKTACRAAGIENWKDIHAHSARHSFASNLLNDGVLPQTVQFAMGHSSLATTAMYGHPNDERVAKFMATTTDRGVQSRDNSQLISVVNVPDINTEINRFESTAERR